MQNYQKTNIDYTFMIVQNYLRNCNISNIFFEPISIHKNIALSAETQA